MFKFEKETEKKGIVRYGARKCGEYNIDDKGIINVDIPGLARRKEWDEKIGNDQEKMKEMLGSLQDAEIDEKQDSEPEPKEEVNHIDKWETSLLQEAEKDNNIAAVMKDGSGAIYKGPATEENIKIISSIEEVEKVLNGRS